MLVLYLKSVLSAVQIPGSIILTPLLYSLVAAGLLKIENKSFSNTPEADKFLVRGRPDYIGGLRGFYNMNWHATLNTAESIRSGKPQAKIDYHTLPEEELLRFFRSQVHSSLRGGKEIAEKLDFSEFEMLLDAGGGTGGVSIAICNKYPQIKATVVDLPKVVQLAERFIAEAGMSDRISVSADEGIITMFHMVFAKRELTNFRWIQRMN